MVCHGHIAGRVDSVVLRVYNGISGHGMRLAGIFLIILLFAAVGCATMKQVEKPEMQDVYYQADIEVHIRAVLEKYGEPQIVVYGVNTSNDEKYLQLYWEIDNFWYGVVFFYKQGKWIMIQNDFARGNI